MGPAIGVRSPAALKGWGKAAAPARLRFGVYGLGTGQTGEAVGRRAQFPCPRGAAKPRPVPLPPGDPRPPHAVCVTQPGPASSSDCLTAEPRTERRSAAPRSHLAP